MFRFLKLSLGVIVRLLRRRGSLLLENLVLRQQLSALKRKNGRPKLTGLDRCFWIAVSRLWSEWKNSLLVVKPETVVEWHRRGFRLYWRLKSKAKQIGRTPISKELQQLIFQMASENPSWGALDHVIPVNERHLRRLLSDYVHYYHDDRTHLGLRKETPNGRTTCGELRKGDRISASRRFAPPLRTGCINRSTKPILYCDSSNPGEACTRSPVGSHAMANKTPCLLS